MVCGRIVIEITHEEEAFSGGAGLCPKKEPAPFGRYEELHLAAPTVKPVPLRSHLPERPNHVLRLCFKLLRILLPTRNSTTVIQFSPGNNPAKTVECSRLSNGKSSSRIHAGKAASDGSSILIGLQCSCCTP